MLLWINGPFGGGKTHTAHEIQRRHPGSVVCDPEHLGIGLRRMMPRQLRGNFQDIPAWRQGTSQVLDAVLGQHDGDVIVPMTVIEPAYLQEIVGPLRANGHQVRHYSLLAARATVLRRLRGRTLPLQRDAFAEAMLDQCLDRLSHDDFAEHIRTDELTIAQVADRIAASAGLTLTPDDNGFLRAYARRTWVTIKHIRIVLTRFRSPAKQRLPMSRCRPSGNAAGVYRAGS
ncbi:MAG TPA: AAA family ATPase [Streptosporangiaceae bacterium]|nr:AAA family ATPase [Streptosporangiaceae bacterium]